MTEPPPTPSLPPTETLINRSKPIWRFFLIANLALGAYMFVGARKKDASIVHSKAAEKSAGHRKATVEAPPDLIAISEIPSLPPPEPEPVTVRQPVPEAEQLELLQWMLEEKRKVKPQDHQEKKRIDEDKAMLKQFIRAKSVPSL